MDTTNNNPKAPSTPSPKGSKTLFEKIWDKHIVKTIADGPSVLYIDKHFIHEVTSPQAFTGLQKRGLNVFRPKQVVATADHNVPTLNQHLPIKEELSRKQVEALITNCAEQGIELYGLGHPFQGIVHVIGPELGITQPGMTIVCGDSHTSTHGAFGAIAFGIGTSEVETKVDAYSSRWYVTTRRCIKRYCALYTFSNYRQRRYWLCSRVCRFCNSLPKYGSPHDHLQYEY
jgi:homoaconitase/3-isopropylmalate dehydratase large subunit